VRERFLCNTEEVCCCFAKGFTRCHISTRLDIENNTCNRIYELILGCTHLL
jgi:hypothetical protein